MESECSPARWCAAWEAPARSFSWRGCLNPHESGTEKMVASVKVIHGANDDFFDLPDGTTVHNVRRNLVDAFNIPAEAISFVNGAPVEPSYRLLPNDSLEFVKRRGEKSILDPDEKAQLDRIEAMLTTLFAEPADDGSPGRSVETLEIAAFINQLRKQGMTWKEVLKACKERWPDDNHVRNVEQVRATFRRFFRSKPD